MRGLLWCLKSEKAAICQNKPWQFSIFVWRKNLVPVKACGQSSQQTFNLNIYHSSFLYFTWLLPWCQSIPFKNIWISIMATVSSSKYSRKYTDIKDQVIIYSHTRFKNVHKKDILCRFSYSSVSQSIYMTYFQSNNEMSKVSSSK